MGTRTAPSPAGWQATAILKKVRIYTGLTSPLPKFSLTRFNSTQQTQSPGSWTLPVGSLTALREGVLLRQRCHITSIMNLSFVKILRLSHTAWTLKKPTNNSLGLWCSWFSPCLKLSWANPPSQVLGFLNTEAHPMFCSGMGTDGDFCCKDDLCVCCKEEPARLWAEPPVFKVLSPCFFFFPFSFFSFPFEVRKTKDTSNSSDLPSNSHCQTQHRSFESEKRNMPVSALFLVSPKCSLLTREPCSGTREASRPAAQHPGQPSALRHRWQHPAHQVPNAVGTRAFPAAMLSESLRVENV